MVLHIIAWCFSWNQKIHVVQGVAVLSQLKEPGH